MNLSQLDNQALHQLHEQLCADLTRQSANRLSLDLTRGKPSPEQLDLSNDLEQQIQGDYTSQDGIDTRNYGGLRGLTEARELGAQLLGVDPKMVVACGNSSLFLMHLTATLALQKGLWGDHRAWQRSSKVKVLTPVPGYDRHFNLCEQLGIEMIPIAMNDQGPDVTAALALASADSTIKGIWCVPKYSNPTGCVYSAAVVEALAQLPTAAAADDFVVFWDNAYAVHDLYDDPEPLPSIKDAADAAGTGEHIVQFASTSKITFAGAGVGFVAAADSVLSALEQQLSIFTIGPDKVSQLCHARFLKGRVRQHMAAHAQILRPKFELVLGALEEGLGDWDIAQWSRPRGGYFVSLDTEPGLASAVIKHAKQAGLALTAAGATFPYGQDPEDRNVRIAPTFANLDELQAAMQLLVLCLKLAAIEKRMVI